MNTLEEIAEALKKSRSVILSGHVMPDGDCLGSVAALGLVLEQMGKKVLLASPEPVPETLTFLAGMERFCIGDEVNTAATGYDTFVALDCSVPQRLGALKPLYEEAAMLVNIDHHPSEEIVGSYNYIDAKAAATGEIVMDLIDVLAVPLTIEVAAFLYVALITDTGSFQYENTTAKTFRQVARLLETGIPASWININLYEEKPLVALKVMEEAMKNLEMSPCGKVAWTFMELHVLHSLMARDEHTDGLIDILRSIKGVEVAIFFKEMSPGKYKVNFRSKGDVDVRMLANKFGGGGHMRASGCVLEGYLETIKRRVVAAAISEVYRVEAVNAMPGGF